MWVPQLPERTIQQLYELHRYSALGCPNWVDSQRELERTHHGRQGSKETICFFDLISENVARKLQSPTDLCGGFGWGSKTKEMTLPIGILETHICLVISCHGQQRTSIRCMVLVFSYMYLFGSRWEAENIYDVKMGVLHCCLKGDGWGRRWGDGYFL